MSTLALADLRFLDLTRVRAGPACVRHFADFGADVIKIEAPGQEDLGGPRDGPDFQNLHRGKRSLTLDLRHPRGREVFGRLVERADVVVENFRPGVKRRLGFDYEALAARNPRIILASISGFGEDGPYRDRPGFDQIAQGLSGLMAVTGTPQSGPLRVGCAVADVTAGLLAALAILTALHERARSGHGQWVQTTLLQAGIHLLDFQAARYTMSGEVPEPLGNDHPTMMPTSAYRTADGHLNLAATGSAMWRRLCEALARPDLLEDALFRTAADRARNRKRLNEEIERTLATQPTAYWIERLNRAGVPCGPILRIDEVFADPQVRHLEATVTVPHPRLGPLRLLANPLRLSRTPAAVRSAAPEKGEHTDQILAELGYHRVEIDALRAEGVV